MSTGGSFSHLSMHVGSSFWVHCATYADTTPILSLDVGDTAVSITPSGTDATDDALRFAQDLARHVQAFADEVERMHAARASTATADGATAASDKAASTTAA
jgi:hypothetical protein